MVVLHLLVAALFALVGFLHLRLNKLHKAFETQGDINRVTKEAFDVLAESIGNTFEEVDKELAKKANKRTKKTPRKD